MAASNTGELVGPLVGALSAVTSLETCMAMFVKLNV